MLAGHEHRTRTAIIGGGAAFAVINAANRFLSGSYFEAHRGAYSPEQMTRIRELFAVTCAVLIALNFVVGLNRRVGAHVLPTVLGLINFGGGIVALSRGLPGVLVACLLVAGTLMPVLAWFSYRRSRAAWAFLTAMCGVFTVVGLFGAPRLRDVVDVNLWTMLIVPGVYAVATVALAQLSHDYATAEPAPA